MFGRPRPCLFLRVIIWHAPSRLERDVKSIVSQQATSCAVGWFEAYARAPNENRNNIWQ